MKVQYKDYRLGYMVFTVKFISRHAYTKFQIMPWHLQPISKMESLKERLFIKKYGTYKWCPKTSPLTLEEKVIACTEELFNL